MGRKHDVVNVKHLARFESGIEQKPETIVRMIVAHVWSGGKGKKETIRYQAEWEDGSRSWAPLANFVDEVPGEEPIVNEALGRYCKRRPYLQAEEGYTIMSG